MSISQHFFRNSKINGLVKSLENRVFVIPVKTGIQFFQIVKIKMDSRFRGNDTFYEFIKIKRINSLFHLSSLVSYLCFSFIFFGCARIRSIVGLPPSPKPAPEIENLEIKFITKDTAVVHWQSPGNKAVQGSKKCFYSNKAQAYRIQYADFKITEENWDSEALIETAEIPVPKKNGIKEELILRNLVPGTQYYLGIKYFIKNTCAGTLDTSELAVISFNSQMKKKVKKLKQTPLTLGSLRRNGYQVVPVLIYHDIVPNPQRSTDVSTDSFYRQMKYLYDNGYTTITTKQLDNFLNVKSRIPRKSVILTFDDGYQSIHQYVYGVLKKFNFRGVLFIYTDAVTGKYRANMSWEQIKEICKDVFEPQAHTKTHPGDIAWKIDNETEEGYELRLNKELLLSKNLIAEHVGKKVEYLAYPYGKYSERLISVLRDKYHYKGAFTVIGAETGDQYPPENNVSYGYNTFFSHPFKIRRLQVLRGTTLSKLKNYLKPFKQEDIIDKDIIRKMNEEINRLDER